MYSREYCEIFKNIYKQLIVCGVCVCVFILFHHEGVFRLQDIWDILGRHGRTHVEYHCRCFCQVPSSPFLKISYILPPRTKTPASTNWKENSVIYGSAKRSYILIYDISRPLNKPTCDEEKLKMRRLL